jgi:hypothetical protein
MKSINEGIYDRNELERLEISEDFSRDFKDTDEF